MPDDTNIDTLTTAMAVLCYTLGPSGQYSCWIIQVIEFTATIPMTVQFVTGTGYGGASEYQGRMWSRAIVDPDNGGIWGPWKGGFDPANLVSTGDITIEGDHGVLWPSLMYLKRDPYGNLEVRNPTTGGYNDVIANNVYAGGHLTFLGTPWTHLLFPDNTHGIFWPTSALFLADQGGALIVTDASTGVRRNILVGSANLETDLIFSTTAAGIYWPTQGVYLAAGTGYLWLNDGTTGTSMPLEAGHLGSDVGLTVTAKPGVIPNISLINNNDIYASINMQTVDTDLKLWATGGVLHVADAAFGAYKSIFVANVNASGDVVANNYYLNHNGAAIYNMTANVLLSFAGSELLVMDAAASVFRPVHLGDPTQPTHAATRKYVDDKQAELDPRYVNANESDSKVGNLYMENPTAYTSQLVFRGEESGIYWESVYVLVRATAAGLFVTDESLNPMPVHAADPVTDDQLATKRYVDSQAGGGSGKTWAEL